MTREFFIGARRPHEGEMLRLGLRQLAASEKQLREFLAAYEEAKSPNLAQRIAEECVFISQTLTATEEVASCGRLSSVMVIAGGLLKVSQRLRELLQEVQRVIPTPNP